MIHICIVAGARPNFVKVAPLIRAIKNTSETDYQLVYVGKADDCTLENTLFSDLQMPAPDVFLDVDSTSLNEITSRVMAEFDQYLDTHPTDVVIVVDDLASTMAAAIVTKKRAIRLAHLVAGTRSFDISMPKEINRLVIDALSDYLFTAGIKSNSVATREQSETSQTYLVGNILMDSLRYNRDRFRKPQLDGIDLEKEPYLVLTLNRKALLADTTSLQQILQTVAQAAGDIPVIAPLRDNAAAVVSQLSLHNSCGPMEGSDKKSGASFYIQSSLSYLEFGWLSLHANGIITDSGNVAEEATFNGVPCITLNSYTEHQETVSVGTNVLVGGDLQLLEKSVRQMVAGEWKQGALPDRWDGRTAERIVKILLTA